MKKSLLLLIILFAFNTSLADSAKNSLLLHPENSNQQQVYVFHNISKQAVFLNHPVSNPSASAGWGSALNPGAWSALAVNRPSFEINCTKQTDLEIVNCQQILKIGILYNLHLQQNGTYWLAENLNTYATLINAVYSRAN